MELLGCWVLDPFEELKIQVRVPIYTLWRLDLVLVENRLRLVGHLPR